MSVIKVATVTEAHFTLGEKQANKAFHTFGGKCGNNVLSLRSAADGSMSLTVPVILIKYCTYIYCIQCMYVHV